MIFGNQVLFVSFAYFARGDHRNDIIVTSRDTNKTRKQANNGDNGYILLCEKFHR